MVSLGFLHIQPSELKIPFELRKQTSCSMQLTNKTNQYIAFKVKTTSPKKYAVRPNMGVVLPGLACIVTVTMQAQKELPHDMHCKDKFLIQSVVVPYGTTSKDITSEMFTKRDGKVIEEFKLRVVYIPANPPSPIPEESEEGYSPRESTVENGSPIDALTTTLEEPTEETSSSKTWTLISMLTEEKASAIQQNQNLQQELEELNKEIRKRQFVGVYVIFVVMVALLGVFVGYLINKT